MIHFVVPRDQDFGILDYTNTWGRNLIGLVSVIHYESLPEREVVPAGSYIFLALDQLTPGGLRLVSELQAQLRESPAAGRVLNDPNTALHRTELLEELHRRGLNRHRAVRATGDLGELRYPVFLREEFRHTGSLSPLLHTPTEVERALGGALLRGHRIRDLLVVEFCETVDSRGYYRKYTAYLVGKEVIARSMVKGRQWMLKAEGIEFSEETFLEERAYVRENPYEDQVRKVFDVAGIEYGRIDFSIKEGLVETWEINTNPTMGPSRHLVVSDEFLSLRQPIRDHFSQRYREALAVLDDQPSEDPIPVSFSSRCLAGASPIVHPPATDSALVRVGRALRPLKPLFDTTERILSPFLARVVRRLP